MNNIAARNRVFPIVFFGIGLALLSVLVFHYGAVRIWESYSHLNELWLMVAVLYLVAATLLGAMNVFILFGQGERPVFTKFLPIYWLSWAMGLVVPGQVGDMATISWAFRKYGVAISFTLSRTMVDKFISLIVMVLIAGVGVMLLANGIDLNYRFPAWMTYVGVAFIGATLLTIGAARTFFDPKKAGWVGSVGRIATEIVYVVKHHPEKIALNAFATFVKVSLIGCTYWAMFAALGYERVPVWQVVSLSTLSGLVAYLPVSFNGLGTVEAVAIVLFGQLGIPPEKVLAGYLCLRVLVIALAWLPSLVWLAANRRV